MPPQLLLSVVIATVAPPSRVLPVIEGLRRQASALGAELLIVTGAAQEPPGGASDVRVHHVPDGSVFDCRAAAFSLARGSIVALTEDHCVHPPDWCARILRHFEERPELMLLGGAVANGSAAQVIDRMNYWMTFATFAPGQVTAQRPCIAQLAIRAAAVSPPLRPGDLENRVIPRQGATPGAIVVDPELCVRHDQSHGFWRTFAVHFHNGRASAGYSQRRAARASVGMLRALRWSGREARVHLRATGRAFAAGGRSRLSTAVHLLLVLPLMLAHATGAVVGYRRGPGRSPHRLS